MGSLRKKGDRWYFSIELPAENGKRKRIERRGGRTKKEAQEKMKLFEAEVLKGEFKEDSKLTFKEVSDIWFKEHVLLNNTLSTQDTYTLVLNSRILPELGDYKIKDITPRVLQDFLNNKKKDDLSKNSIKQIKSIVSSVMKYAVFPLEEIKENPMQYVSLPKIKDKESKLALTMEEYEMILNSLNKEKDAQLKRLIEILFNTGMRVGELNALHWSDIDFENKIIHVKYTIYFISRQECKITPPKTEESVRDIFVNDYVLNLLKKEAVHQKECMLKYGEHYEHSDLVFTRDNGKFFVYKNYIQPLCRLSEKLGFKFTFHTFRHTHATMLLEAGVSIKQIQERLGHKNIKTTMDVYTKVSNDSKKEVVQKFDELISKKTF